MFVLCKELDCEKMIYESQEIAEFFKGKSIEEPKDLKEAKLTTKSIEQQQKIVLEGLKTLDKESLIKVKKWIEK